MNSNSESNLEIFATMKENALFLLELSSTNSRESIIWKFNTWRYKRTEYNSYLNSTAILGNQKKLPFQMPVVDEHQMTDLNRPGSSQMNNRYGKSYKCSRKSEASSPDLIWTANEMFQCLESLGANVARESAPYDRISYSESSFDRVSNSLNCEESQIHLTIQFSMNCFIWLAAVGYFVGHWRQWTIWQCCPDECFSNQQYNAVEVPQEHVNGPGMVRVIDCKSIRLPTGWKLWE